MQTHILQMLIMIVASHSSSSMESHGMADINVSHQSVQLRAMENNLETIKSHWTDASEIVLASMCGMSGVEIWVIPSDLGYRFDFKYLK